METYVTCEKSTPIPEAEFAIPFDEKQLFRFDYTSASGENFIFDHYLSDDNVKMRYCKTKIEEFKQGNNIDKYAMAMAMEGESAMKDAIAQDIKEYKRWTQELKKLERKIKDAYDDEHYRN
jgi:hypothetical protein